MECSQVTVTGLTFLIALSARLDGELGVSYVAILGPLIVGYSLLLLFYLIFTVRLCTRLEASPILSGLLSDPLWPSL